MKQLTYGFALAVLAASMSTSVIEIGRAHV